MHSDLHPVVGQIKNVLEEKSIEYRFFEHEAVRTSEEAIRERPGYTLNQGAKAIILCAEMPDKERKFFMTVFPAHKRLDNKKTAASIGAKKIRFATAEESSVITRGIEFGGIPPFGTLFGLQVIVDPALFKNEEIIFNCGDRRASIAMRSDDYKKLVEHTMCSITE